MATTTGSGKVIVPSENIPEQMRHVDIMKDKISPEQKAHMEKMEKQLQEQARKMKKLGRRNAGVALGLGLAVVGIFTYSIYSVGRESFLDNLDDPNKPKDE